MYWRFGQQMAVRQGNWKLVRYDAAADGESDRGVSPQRLYNLANDIGESHDLADQEPEHAANLPRVGGLEPRIDRSPLGRRNHPPTTVMLVHNCLLAGKSDPIMIAVLPLRLLNILAY